MEPIPIESIEEEDGILFEVVKVKLDSYELYEGKDFVKPGYCKVILKIDNSITRTHYFKNGIETSKEKILHDERIKSLRR